jgi:hypothetical protein
MSNDQITADATLEGCFAQHRFTVGRASVRLTAEDRAVREALRFTDRESYLAWVAAWKAAYRRVADEIRAQRRIMRDPAAGDLDRGAAMSRRHSGRIAAFNLLVLRHAGKAESRRRRDACRAAAA